MCSNHPSIHVLLLSETQAPLYKALRLRALRDHPDAFMETHEAFEARTIDSISERMRESQSRGGFTLVAQNNEGMLVGTASLAVGDTTKNSHRGLIWGVYVAPEARSMGVGARLLQELMSRAAQNPRLRNLRLAVLSSNEPARRLYTSLGFTEDGLDVDALCVDGELFSETLMSLKLPRA